MRKLAIGALAILATATLAFGDMGAEVKGVLAMPMGDFGDWAAMGFGGGAKFYYGFSPSMGIGVEFDYVMFGTKEVVDTILGTEFSTKTSATAIPIKLDFCYMFMPDSPFDVYVDVLMGYYMLTPKVEVNGESTTGDTESKFGFGGGLGFLYMMSPTMALDVSALYNHILTEDSATQYLDFGMGLMFFFGGEEY